MVREDIVNFIKQQQAKGFPLESIKSYLIQYGSTAKDVDDAINFMQNNTGLEDYVKQQMNIGYTHDQIEQFLVSKGYDKSIVDNALSNVEPHEHKEKRFLILILLVLLGAILVTGMSYILLSDNSYAAEISTTTTRIMETTTTMADTITTTTYRLSTTTKDGGTTTTQTTQKTTTTGGKITTTTRITFTPETAPLNEIINHIQDIGVEHEDSAKLFCDRVTKEQFQDSCYHELAKTANNMDYCSQISNIKKKDSCYISFAMKKDYTACDYIETESLRNSCNVLRRAESSRMPQIKNIPKIVMEMNVEYELNLNSHINIVDVNWTVFGGNKINVSIGADKIAKIIPNVDWSGEDSFKLTACLNGDCDEQAVQVTIEKSEGFIMEMLPTATLIKDSDASLSLMDYVNVEDGVVWTLPTIEHVLLSLLEGDILHIKGLDGYFGNLSGEITGCVNSDCDSKLLEIVILEGSLFNFVIPEYASNIYRQKNQAYDQLNLSEYIEILANGISIDNFEFNHSITENLSISVDSETMVMIIPATDWTGSESVTLTACTQFIHCQEQIINIEVVE